MAGSDVLNVITQFLKDKREREDDARDDSLKMLNMQLNMQSHLLGNQINRLDRNYEVVYKDYLDKKMEYESLTGEIVNVDSLYQGPTNPVEILDLVKSPIMEGHENEINKIRTDTYKLENSLSTLNQRLTAINKVQDFYSGKTVDPGSKTGTDPDYFDKGDFSTDQLLKNLGGTYESVDDLPTYLANAVQKGGSELPVKMDELNTLINTQLINKYEQDYKKYRYDQMNDPTFKIEEYIKDQTTNFATSMDMNINSIVSGPMAGIISDVNDLSRMKEDPDVSEEMIAQAETALQLNKMNIGSSFTGIAIQTGDVLTDAQKFDNLENERLGAMILGGISTYWQSMEGTPGDRSKRNVGPILGAFKEMRLWEGKLLKDLEKIGKKYGINSKEYQSQANKIEVIHDNIQKYTGYDIGLFKQYAPILEDIHSSLKKGGLDLLTKEYEIFNDQKKELNLDMPKSELDLEEDRSLFKDDYYKFNPTLKNFFNLDTNNDGQPDAIDWNNDGQPDSQSELESNFGRTEVPEINEEKEFSKDAKLGDEYIVDVEQGEWNDTKGDYDRVYKLYDNEGDNEYIRTLTDDKDIAYYSNYSVNNTAAKNATLKNIFSNPSRKNDVLMYYVNDDGKFDIDAIAKKLNIDFNDLSQTQLKEIQRLTGITGKDSFARTSQHFGSEDLTKEYTASSIDPTSDKKINPIVNIAPAVNRTKGFATHLNDLTAGGALSMSQEIVERPNWNIFTALGGGDLHGDNSPYYDAYYKKLQEIYNNEVDVDDSIWFKTIAKFGDTKEALGSGWPTHWFFDEDFEVVQQLKENYPDIWEKADKLAHEAGMKDQKNWIAAQFEGKASIGVKKDSEGDNFTIDIENQNEILKILAGLHGVKYQ